MSDPAAAAQPEGVVEAAAVPQEGAPAEAAPLDPAVAQGLTDPAQLAAYQAMLQAGAFGFGQVGRAESPHAGCPAGPRWPAPGTLPSPTPASPPP